MDIGKSFSYVFEDEEWIKKLLIGGLVAIVPIVFFAAFGYVIQIARNVADGHERPLPDWDEFGKYFVEGFKFTVGMIVYYLPLILLTCCFTVFAIAVSESVNGSEVDAVMGLSMMCFIPLITLFSLIPYLLIPALIARFAETEQIGAMFRFGEIWGLINNNIGNYLLVLLIAFVVTSFIAPLGLILFCFGVIFTQWWAYLVVGHLSGQLMTPAEA